MTAVAAEPDAEPERRAAALDAATLDAGSAAMEEHADVDGGRAVNAVASAASAVIEEAVSSEAERAPNDPRFDVRWEKPALCPGDPGGDTERRRARLLSTFQKGSVAGWPVFLEPSLPLERGTIAEDAVGRAHAIVQGLVGPIVANVRMPEVFVYRDVEQMLEVSCVNRAARGYYDGAIHVAGDWDLEQSVMHEYVHHALNQIGLRRPMWLHEGLGMFVAQETWWRDPRLGLQQWIHGDHLPFDAMADAFPHASDELFAGAAYFQSYLMVLFVHEHGAHDLASLVEALARGDVQPRQAFAEASGLPPEALERTWRAFVAQPR